MGRSLHTSTLFRAATQHELSLRPSTHAAAGLSGALLAWTASAASAAERGAIGNQLDDRIVVGFALILLVATAALNFSLGDVAGDEANLPSSAARVNDLRQRRSDFLKSRTPPK